MMKHRIASLFPLVLALFLVYSVSLAQPAGNQTTAFIDVGEGDAILLQDGAGVVVLVDGGKSSAGPAVDSYLHSQGITEINVMVATHADADHIGGLITVLRDSQIHIDRVLYNGYAGSTATWTDFANAVTADGIILTPIQFPGEEDWGLFHVYVLNPASGLIDPEQNNASVVLLVKYKSMKYLLTGDIDSTEEATIVARQTPVAAQILKVPHHGSQYSSSSSFLMAVQPTNGVISVGPNTYGHPAPETLARLQAASIIIWRTDQTGTVLVTSNGENYAINEPLVFFRIYLPSLRR